MTTNPDPPSKLIRNSTAEFLIFTAQDGDSSIEARYEDETIWLTQRLMAELFDVDVRTISEHLGNVFSSGELERKATIRKFRIVRSEGSRQVTRSIDHYNLDAIISVGYRVNSVRATQFRQWATGVLRDFAVRSTPKARNRAALLDVVCRLESECERHAICGILPGPSKGILRRNPTGGFFP